MCAIRDAFQQISIAFNIGQPPLQALKHEMTLSMTAFARRERSTPWGDLTWELRSINHRYLEISPRLPEDIRRLEPRIRELLSGQISRGRVDCNLRFQPKDTELADVDEEVVRRLIGLAGKMADMAPALQPLRIIDVLHWPGVIKATEIDPEGLEQEVLDSLRQALEELMGHRRREGNRLSEIILERLAEAETLISKVREILPVVVEAYRKRLEQRLGELRNEVDPTRLEQELVLFLHKSDVQEELDRLMLHIDEVRRALDEPKPVGRRLDFLMQELHREANTLGSKSIDAGLSAASVDLKVMIEQMREQTQNIE